MTTMANPTAWLAGYIPDLATPFDDAGGVDLKAFAGLCERQITAGVSAIVVCETAGEASTMSPEEQEQVIRTGVETARGRCRVIAGALSNSTGQAIENARRAQAAGADAILSVVPYYIKPMQAGLLAHFRAIAAQIELPVVLHDIPSRTVRELADDTLARLVESKQFIGLRDGSGDITRPIRLRPQLPASFRLLSGDDVTALAYIASGGDGCISLVSNVAPELCAAIFSYCKVGRLQRARYLQNRIVQLAAALARDNPPALKYALGMLGLMRPGTRLPIVELDTVAKNEIAKLLASIADEDLIGAA